MGVHGLWKLLEAAGKPVPLETLENKVLAVDVSIWLHQMMKGYQDSRGAPVPNAHLLGLFHRVCKLLYYRIKPVFVFDGGVPLLKKQTIAARKKLKKQASQSAAEAKEKLLRNLVRRKAVRQILGSKISDETLDDNAAREDMFHLPPMPHEQDKSSSSGDECHERPEVFMESSGSDESEPEAKPSLQQLRGLDLHSLDVSSEEFCSLPPDVRHDILSELKETRKQNSWGRLHEMPEESGEFSSYQLGRLLKRRNVQVSLEKAEKEMGGKVLRMNELQELMTAQGVKLIEETPLIDSASQRIASDSSTRYVLCKDSTSEEQTSQSTETSSTRSSKMEDEQSEFIANMAKNMLQQMSKKKQEINAETKEEQVLEELHEQVKEEKLVEVIHELRPGSDSTGISSRCQKILADSWSSDEDDAVCGANSKRSQISKLGSKGSRSDSTSEVIGDIPNKSSSSSEQVPLASEEFYSNIDNSNENFVSDEESEEDQVGCSTAKIEVPKALLSEISAVVHLKGKTRKTPSFSDQEIFIHTREKPDDDDLFADIFQGSEQRNPIKSQNVEDVTKLTYEASEISPLSNEDKQRGNNMNIRCKISQADPNLAPKKPIEIVICPSDKLDDDIFADIFESSFQKKIPELEETEEKIKPGLKGLKNSDKKISNEISKTPIKEEISSSNDSDSLITSPGDDLNVTESNASLSSLFSKPPSSSEWNEVEAFLETEQSDLQKERGRQERLAASITDQMCVEAQELLQLFGLPFIVAPMEAEAQCAFLDAISMTEGSITDDSDIWLFGGRKVYKNFFNQKKHVLQYTLSNINHYFKLSREQLVQLALLVGSDYTTGIQGVGPVTALEIVAAFQGRSELDPIQCAVKGLKQFKDWWNLGRPHKSNSMRLLDKKLKNVKFSEGFPSQAVVEAYLRPSVDDSRETFSWGKLDVPALREYARSKFGWTMSKTDEILMPVAKRWTAKTNQRVIDSYFSLQPNLVEGLNKMSKRVQKAVSLMGADEVDNEDVDDPDPKPSSSRKENKLVKRRPLASTDKKVKRMRIKDNEPNEFQESVPDDKEQRVKNNMEHKAGVGMDIKEKELPVRAPTVPRARSSTGVKRVGVQSIERIGGPSKAAVKTVSNLRIESISQPTTKRIRKLNTSNVSSKKDAHKKSSKALSTDADRSEGIVAKNDTLIESDEDFMDPKPSGSGIVSCSTGKAAPRYSHSDSSSDNDEGENVLSELAALSEMNWEDDPWSCDNINTDSKEGHSRPKVFFGGIRPNRPKKTARSRPVIPVRTTDTRGVQPGWLTEDRLQSRSTAWVDAVHRKREESIPQRDRDQKALDQAKMKAISHVKATDAKQATRVLGGAPKRGRKRVKPIRKELPEHNLSESSSDD